MIIHFIDGIYKMLDDISAILSNLSGYLSNSLPLPFCFFEKLYMVLAFSVHLCPCLSQKLDFVFGSNILLQLCCKIICLKGPSMYGFLRFLY